MKHCPPIITTGEARFLYADRRAIVEGDHLLTRAAVYTWRPETQEYVFLHEGPVEHVCGIRWDRHTLRFVPCPDACCAHLDPLERAELARYNDLITCEA